MELKYTLIENGLDFIHRSLEYLERMNEANRQIEIKGESPEDKRNIKYAILHLSSGVELILKGILLKNHWTYVFSNMNQAEKVKFDSGDFSSVDMETIIERLKTLCEINIKEKEKKDLMRLRNFRNKIEHFNFNINKMHANKIIQKNIEIIIEIILNYYGDSEFIDDETELFNKIKILLKDSENYIETYKSAILNNIISLNLETNRTFCPECGEEFLIIHFGSDGCSDKVKCFLCEYEDTSINATERYFDNIMNINKYSVIKAGGYFPLYTCDECGNTSLIYDENNNRVLCYECNCLYNFEQYAFCNICTELFIKHDKYELDTCQLCMDNWFLKD